MRNVMKNLMILMALTAVTVMGGCDNKQYYGCDTASQIGGEESSCNTGREFNNGRGVCVASAQGNICVPRCDDRPNNPATNQPHPLCEQPEFWFAMPFNGHSVCFCFNVNSR